MLGGVAAALQIGTIFDEAEKDLAELDTLVVEVSAFLEFWEATSVLRTRWVN